MNYESSLKAQRDYYSSMSFAEQKGIEKGIEKGKIEEVLNLITKLGLSDKEVARVADVTISFVKQIRLQQKK
jgi:predicted transposase/invertase (TIGR01784 family)